MTEASTVRHRNVTWQDPLVGAALALRPSGLECLLAIAEGCVIERTPLSSLGSTGITQLG